MCLSALNVEAMENFDLIEQVAKKTKTQGDAMKIVHAVNAPGSHYSRCSLPKKQNSDGRFAISLIVCKSAADLLSLQLTLMTTE